ncbi:MAG TPA: TusE/DsrC/DsvC family sulfur relay protein [Anaerolineales bacterium]|nr:TusE/DsrC/DsvC family sulfur relay protein [Anaerolineales bacterium]
MSASEETERLSGPYPVDADGFLTAPEQWDDEVARTLAYRDGVELTDAHWKVIRFLRSEYERVRMVPTMREVRQGTGYSTRDLFGLFPAGGP